MEDVSLRGCNYGILLLAVGGSRGWASRIPGVPAWLP